MDLSFTDEQQFLREAVRGSVDRDLGLPRIRALVLEGDVDHVPAHEHCVAQGWSGIGIPEEAGGQGGGLLELAILAEELGRGAVPADGIYASILAALALHRGGDERAAETTAAICEGERTAALVVPGSAPLDAGVPDGPVELVLGAPLADAFVTIGGDGALEVRDAGEVEVSPRRLVDRTRSVASVTPGGPAATSVAGPDDAAWTELAGWAAVLVAADALGAAQRMLDLTVEYVAERVQFGVPVGSFQAVKHAAAEMLTSLEGARSLVQYAAWAVGEGEPGGLTDAWAAKARAARMATFVADKALFLHGAVGYTWEHDLQLLFKRAKSDAALLGGPGAYDDRIADALALTG